MVETLEGTRGERSLAEQFTHPAPWVIAEGCWFHDSRLLRSGYRLPTSPLFGVPGGSGLGGSIAPFLASGGVEEDSGGVDVFHVRTIAPPLAHVKRNISAIFAGING